MKKNFSEDIRFFKNKLEAHIPFTLSKYADGEWSVMTNKQLNNNEFKFELHYQKLRDELITSFKFQHPNYYVGISCPCCQGQRTFELMRDFSGQDEQHLTWANIWVNANYEYYLKEIVPLYNNYQVFLIAHKDSSLLLPFNVSYFCPINKNAWIEDYDLIKKLKNLIDIENISKSLFLFCCGPFGNLLAHQLTAHNDTNTYLDIGSTLNPMLKTEGFKRGYFTKYKMMKPCIWG